MSKYVSDYIFKELSKSVKNIKSIRQENLLKYGVDLIDNDNMSLLTFCSIIRKIDPNYNCNLSRNGEDGYTIINEKKIILESKTAKLKKNKKGVYNIASFAFHAEGNINHDGYIFTTWDKTTLNPIKIYYIKNKTNVEKINKKLKELSDEWKKKPSTKSGFDIIYINEKMLFEMVKSTQIIDKCVVNLL